MKKIFLYVSLVVIAFSCSCSPTYTHQPQSTSLSYFSGNVPCVSYVGVGKSAEIAYANQLYFYLDINLNYIDFSSFFENKTKYVDILFSDKLLFSTKDFVIDLLGTDYISLIITIPDNMLNLPFTCNKIKINGDNSFAYDVGTTVVVPHSLSDKTVYINYSPYYFSESLIINENFGVDYHLIVFNDENPSSIKCGFELPTDNLHLIDLMFSFSEEITNQARHDLKNLGASYTPEQLDNMKVYVITMVFHIRYEENIILKPYFDIDFNNFSVTTLPPTPMVILY